MRSTAENRRYSIRSLTFAAFLCLSVMLGSAYTYNVRASGSHSPSVLAADLDATFATQWMQLVYDRVLAENISAPAASRVYAYAGVTLYEAVRPGMPSYQSLHTQIKGMPEMPAPAADAAYDWPSVANAALTVVMSGLIPVDATRKALSDFHDKQAAERKSAAGADVVDRSLKYGEAVGTAMLDWANSDNYKDASTKAYTLPTGDPWDYALTSPGTKPVGAYWGTLRPFSLENADVCEIKRNIDFSTDPSSALYIQAMEVKTTGDKLTDEQKGIANFWVDTPGITGAPAGHWVSIENQLVPLLKLKLDRAAEMYAMVGMALGDAFISCWELKYKDPFLRPVTYITRYIMRNWSPFIQTPPFPSYTSGHSVASEAAAEVLTGMFGQVAFTDKTHVSRGQPARSFTSFEAAANEAAISRLYGGIHYRFDIENGLRQGRCVGQSVLTHIHLHSAS